MSGSMKKNFDKTKIFLNSKIGTEGAHSKLLLSLFEMPHMRHYDGKAERKYKHRKDAMN